ncbi:MAG: phosphoribosylamine--glycine ligase [Polyangiaceae bacterium UTPRO1]|jgi:phosphoribosylamine--glycine ligase|nr:phosphoribosylamine--glycine ligase [Myxococcales bacterium]OQY69228.1 MAG: phosphoribosylamine--glycine ligase [Polyangiaceae bacterium UTPRO1]
MRILMVGGGGREHALLWKLAQSARRPELFCAPGNAGTAELAENCNVAAGDIAGLVALAAARDVDLTIVGPELPLTAGIVDAFAATGRRIFGPSRRAAELEGSKAFMKTLLARLGVPTAAHRTFDDHAAARRYLDEIGAPVVLKADGLAAGKGVLVCDDLAAARAGLDEIMVRRAFGAAGARVVIEEFLPGEELSFMALTDGTTVVPLASSQDHKRVGDGDTGPNTGGMGAYSPAPVLTPTLEAEVMETIVHPVVAGLAAAGIVYRGVLYAGLMVVDGRPRVLEFNVRFGDPECQVLMMRLRSDLVDLVEGAVTGGLAGCRPAWDPRPAAGVVLAAEGYPGEPVTGDVISGAVGRAASTERALFHAGTARRGAAVVTRGGRVLTACALGADLAGAIANAYEVVASVGFRGMHYRRDIGHRALARAQSPPAAREGE